MAARLAMIDVSSLAPVRAPAIQRRPLTQEAIEAQEAAAAIRARALALVGRGVGGLDKDEKMELVRLAKQISDSMPGLRGDPQEVRRIFRAARDAARDFPDTVAESLMVQSLGELCVGMGELDEARASFLRGLELRYSWMYPFMHLGLAKVSRCRQDVEEARRSLSRARAELTAHRAHVGLATEILREEINVEIAAGTPDRAAALFRTVDLDGLDAIAAVKMTTLEIDVLLGAGRFQSAVRKIERAREAERLFVAEPTLDRRLDHRWALAVLGMSDRAREAEAVAVLEGALGRAGFVGPDRVIALLWVSWRNVIERRFGLAEARLGEALQLARSQGNVAQELRALALRGSLLRRRGAPVAELRAALDELDAAYRRRIEQLRGRAAGGAATAEAWSPLQYSGDRRMLAELVNLHWAVGGGSALGEAFESVLRFETLGSIATARRLETPSLAAIRSELLAPREGLLVFLPAPEASHVFAVDGATVVHATIEAEEDLSADLSDFIATVSAAPRITRTGTVDDEERERAIDVGRAVGRRLLPAGIMRRVLSWDRVLVVGADDLNGVPLEALVPPRGRPLGLTHSIRYASSVGVALGLARKTAPSETPARDLIVLAPRRISSGVSARWSELRPLDFDADRLAALGRGFDPSRVEVACDEPVGRRRFLSIGPEDTRVLVFLGHGVFDIERECAALVMEPSSPDEDGLLRVADLGDWRCPSIIVFASCGAERGPRRRGEDGVEHFGGRALLAGATTVVISRADLDLDATLRLLEVFLEGVARGDRPADALRAARVALAESLDHPSCHSLLHVLGR